MGADRSRRRGAPSPTAGGVAVSVLSASAHAGQDWFGPDKAHKAVVSVKGGKNLGVGMVRDLDAVIAEQKAAIGVFLTLDPPTSKMVEWANKAGTFAVDGFPPIPRIQIVPIERALKERERAVQVPLRHADTYKKAPAEAAPDLQGKLGL